jgi:hypothetical protein
MTFELGRYGIATLLMIGLATFLAAARLANRIRTTYPDLYDRVGRPSLSLEPRSMKEQWRFFCFIMRRDYNRLGDLQIRLLGDAIFFGSLICYGLILFGTRFNFK